MSEKSGKLDVHKLLPYLIFGGVVLGIVIGGASPAIGKELSFIGDLFMRALLMLVVPLIMTSIIVGISQLGDVRKLGGLAKKTIFYFISTTFLAATLGLVLVNVIQPGIENESVKKELLKADKEKQIPGDRIAKKNRKKLDEKIQEDKKLRGEGEEESLQAIKDSKIPAGEFTKDKIKDKANELEQNLLDEAAQLEKEPENEFDVDEELEKRPLTEKEKGIELEKKMLDEAAQTEKGKEIEKDIGKKEPDIRQVFKDIIVGLVPKNLFKAMVDTDLLPIILFSLVFGAVVTTIGERGKTCIQFFQGANDAIMKIVDLLMLCAPIGICALIAGRLGEAGGLVEFMGELQRLGKYAATVMSGLGIFSIIVLPLILYFIAKPKVGVWTYFSNMWAAILTAFSTASSAAALPITMESAIQSGVARRNANFVLPLGTTLNMNGTALYEAVAAVFIAQISGVELTNVHMILIATTASLAAIGAASIPEAGLVTMLIVLKAAGLPTENVSLILIIDWFLDRCRTAVNVWGDAVGAAVVNRFEPVYEDGIEPEDTGDEAVSESKDKEEESQSDTQKDDNE